MAERKGWDAISSVTPPGASAQQDREAENQRELNRCAIRALAKDEQLALRRYLERIAMSRSYKPGREHSETAWSEGYRALAVELLTRGGLTHE